MSTRLRALDGLRGLAIAAVVGLHAFGVPRQGQLGVDLFFVLSGFLITRLLVEEWVETDRVDLRAFYVRRIRRLYPALIVMLAAVVPTLIVHSGVAKALFWVANALAFSTNFFVSYMKSYATPLTPLWSLAQEEQFYLVWPLLLLRFASRRRILFVLLLTLIAAATWRGTELLRAGAQSGRILYAPDTRSIGILVGCLVALVACSPYASTLRSAARLLAWPGLVALLSFPFLVSGPEIVHGGLLLFTVAAAVVIVGALDTTSTLSRLLGVRPLAYLGRISYSLYLWNLPVILLLGKARGAPHELLVVAVALLVASGSYRYVEQPFLHHRKRRAQDTLPRTDRSTISDQAVSAFVGSSG